MMSFYLTWILIIGFLLLCLVLGIWASRGKDENIDDFLVAGRKIKSLWGIATLSSTEMGLVTIVYFSQEAFENGFVALITGVIAALTMWLIGRTGFVVKKLREMEIRTVPEYFIFRYSNNIRVIAGVLTFLTGILNMGIFLQVEGRFLCIILGLPINSLAVVMGVLLVFVIIYTAIGGMYSVVVTDVFQFVLILIGIIITSFYAFGNAGGFSGMIASVNKNIGPMGFDVINAPKYGIIFIIWTTLYYLSGWSSWQPVVQRTLSMESVTSALKLFRLTSIFMFFRSGMPIMWGIAALAVLGPVENTQTALPVMLLQVIPSWMIGFIVIGFLAASMSTYSSYILSFSAILVQDIVGPLMKKDIKDSKRISYTRVGIIVIGLFIFFWGVYYNFTDTVFRIIALTGSLSYAGIISVLTGGIYWKKANTYGAYAAFILSAVPPIYSIFSPAINPVHAGLLSFVLAPIGMVIGSLLFSRKQLNISN
ncbi:MAG: sodium:solute symporter family protein [Ignavibacteriales bacterium]|nr:MAG: sodium:solute symporter family protein [Ignavibacteriales bacterium]